MTATPSRWFARCKADFPPRSGSLIGLGLGLGRHPGLLDALEVRPHVVDLALQRVEITCVVDEVRRDLTPLFVGGLRGHPRGGVVAGEAAHDEPVEAQLGRRLDHDHRGVGTRSCSLALDEQRDVAHDDRVVAGRRDLSLGLGADRGPGDLAECLAALVVRERNGGEPGAVEGAVGGDDALTEPLDQGRERGHPRLHHESSDGVGVDDHRSVRREQRRHRGLAGTDPARECHQHGPDDTGPDFSLGRLKIFGPTADIFSDGT